MRCAQCQARYGYRWLLLLLLLLKGTDVLANDTLHVTAEKNLSPLLKEVREVMSGQPPRFWADWHRTHGELMDRLQRGDTDLLLIAEDQDRPGYENVGDAVDDFIRRQTIARDRAVLVVHASNPLAQVTLQQARSMLEGEVTHWPNDHRPIMTAIPGKGRCAEKLLRTLEVDREAVEQNRFYRVHSDMVMLSLLGGDPQALGIASLSSLRSAIQAGALVRWLPIEGVVGGDEPVCSINLLWRVGRTSQPQVDLLRNSPMIDWVLKNRNYREIRPQ